MDDILTARGCVYLVPAKTNKEGFYSLDGLDHGHKSSKDTPILLRSITMQDVDLTSPVTTLSGVRVLYRFGKGVGDVRINGDLLLGQAGGNPTNQKDLISFFDSNRVSVKEEPIEFTLPGGHGGYVYLTGLILGETDPATHTQPFALVGYLASL